MDEEAGKQFCEYVDIETETPCITKMVAKFQAPKAKLQENQLAERPKDGAFIGGVIY